MHEGQPAERGAERLVESDQRQTAGKALDCDPRQTFPCRGVHEQPRGRHHLQYALLRQTAGEHGPRLRLEGGRHGFDGLAFGSVADQCQPAPAEQIPKRLVIFALDERTHAAGIPTRRLYGRRRHQVPRDPFRHLEEHGAFAAIAFADQLNLALILHEDEIHAGQGAGSPAATEDHPEPGPPAPSVGNDIKDAVPQSLEQHDVGCESANGVYQRRGMPLAVGQVPVVGREEACGETLGQGRTARRLGHPEERRAVPHALEECGQLPFPPLQMGLAHRVTLYQGDTGHAAVARVVGAAVWTESDGHGGDT